MSKTTTYSISPNPMPTHEALFGTPDNLRVVLPTIRHISDPPQKVQAPESLIELGAGVGLASGAGTSEGRTARPINPDYFMGPLDKMVVTPAPAKKARDNFLKAAKR